MLISKTSYHCKLALLTTALGFVATPAFGAGFQLNEQGAIGTGRAGAVISTIKGPSAVYHNPAALTQTEGTQFMAGASIIVPGATYVGNGRPVDRLEDTVRQSTEREPVPVPHVYASHALSKKAVVGIGFYNHYGLGISWENPDEWVGRTLVQELSLRTFFLTPTVALKLNDWLSVAVGVSLVPATLKLERVIGATDNGQVVFPATANSPEGSVDIAGSAFGVGATAGVLITPTKNLRLGFSYRSAVDLSFEGDADFTVPEGTPASVAASFPDQSINGDLTLPHTFLAGIGWEADSWTVELAGQVTLWTSYDELRVNFEDQLPVPTSANDRSWEVAPMFRLGGEYRFEMPLALRLGVAYDVSPAPDRTVDPTLPDNDRIIGTLGAGYDFGPVRVDVAYMALFVQERTITPEDNNVNFPPASDMDTVVYESTVVHLASLSLGVAL